MATQRITVAVLGGESGRVARKLLQSWRAEESCCDCVDQFCSALRAHGAELPVVYCCEWVDRWLMGDSICGLNGLCGRTNELACYSRREAIEWAEQCPTSPHEAQWLAAQLRQASQVWPVEDQGVVLVIRQVIGPSSTDEEVASTLHMIPEWLSQWH